MCVCVWDYKTDNAAAIERKVYVLESRQECELTYVCRKIRND